MNHLLYFGLLAGCLIATAPLEVFLGVRVYRQWRRLVRTVVPVAVVFCGWDLYAISRHEWTYASHWIVGAYLPGRLPVEELAFFVVIPTCAVLTLEAVRARRPEWLIGDEG